MATAPVVVCGGQCTLNEGNRVASQNREQGHILSANRNAVIEPIGPDIGNEQQTVTAFDQGDIHLVASEIAHMLGTRQTCEIASEHQDVRFIYELGHETVSFM